MKSLAPIILAILMACGGGGGGGGSDTTPTKSVKDGPTQVVIWTGQSLAAMGGVDTVLPRPDQPDNVKFKNLSVKFLPGAWGPEQGMMQVFGDEDGKWLVLKYAASGTYSRQWLPGEPHYETMMRRIKYQLSLLDSYELRAWCHQQGESDSLDESAYEYRANVEEFISAARVDLEEDIPVILGQVIRFDDAPYLEVVRSALIDIAVTVDGVTLINNDDLEKRSDGVHNTPRSTLTMGERFGRAVLMVR